MTNLTTEEKRWTENEDGYAVPASTKKSEEKIYANALMSKFT